MSRFKQIEAILFDNIATGMSALGIAGLIFQRPLRRLISQKQSDRHITFVCLGNICRSPYAEFRFREMIDGLAEQGSLKHQYIVNSAGIDTTPDKPANATALAVAAKRGLDLQPHRTKLAVGDLLASSDLILVMDSSHFRVLTSKYPEIRSKVMYLGAIALCDTKMLIIRDPYGLPESRFDGCFDQIDANLKLLLQRLEADE